MNLTRLFTVIAIFSILSCSKEADLSEIIDTPVSIENFRINLEDIKSNEITKVGLEDKFRVSYDLRDEGMIKDHEFYFLINDDEGTKYVLYPLLAIDAQEMTFNYTFDSFKKLSLGDGEYYFPEVGEKFHFYLHIKDDTGNMVEKYFVVELV